MACEEKAKNEVVVADFPTAIQTMRGIQQSFLVPVPPRRVSPLEPKGVVYTKRWVVELLLDLAGYTSSANLVDTIAVEPSAGDGAFLGRMIERLADSCERQGRAISDCRNSLINWTKEVGARANAGGRDSCRTRG
jgi:adenine-specific DNA-methyltransferase